MQEHWLTHSQLDAMNNINSDYIYTTVSGLDNTQILGERLKSEMQSSGLVSYIGKALDYDASGHRFDSRCG
jgi:hypothetical protein